MAKTVVVYKSKYGSTKKYAEWIAKAVDADILPHSKATIDKLLTYDIIIYGGVLYALGIIGFSLIKDNYARFKEKKLIVFSVGASPARKQALEDVMAKNFTDEMRENIHYFHLRGGLNYKKMNFIDKTLMFLLMKKIARMKPEERDEDSKALFATYGKTVDFSSEKNIQPIADYVRFLQSNI